MKSCLNRVVRLVQWPLLCGWLFAAHPLVAQATGYLYEVDSPATYNIPPDTLPPIDYTNFVNNSTFTVNFNSFLLGNVPLFETWNTLNYTNIGTLASDTGFMFDRQVTNAFGNTVHQMAGTFYNPGAVACASGIVSFGVAGQGQCIVNATNIIINNGGSVDVGQNGLIQLVGQNLDLRNSVMTLEGGGLGSVQAIPNVPPFTFYAGWGLDTNNDWDPSIDLTPFFALPSLVRMGATRPAFWEWPFAEGIPGPSFIGLSLFTTPYYVETDVATNNIVFRSVFVENTAPNVTANVYINGLYYTINNGVFVFLPGTGEGVVELVGTYTNPATGLPANNYLYLRDDYAQGANNPGFNAASGIPNNFTFTPSSFRLVSSAPLTPAFSNFPAGPITNNYAYVDAQCVPTTVLTNTPSTQLTNYLAVLPNRIQIAASSNLDMTGMQISGQNYMSVSSSQLNGNASAGISSAYADIDITSTNSNLVATNLLEPSVPAWNGKIQAWSTRFIVMSTNTVITITNQIVVTTDTNNVSTTNFIPVATTNSWAVTNDYRVVIVANQAVPYSPSAVWGLALRNTNNIVISDAYNILNSLYLNCVGLTLTSNGPGATSPVGELNLQSSSVNWAAATPFLRYLTNNGAILLPFSGPNSLGVFGSAAAPYGALINNGVISDQGSQIWANNFVDTGTFLNGSGSFTLFSQTATFTGASLTASNDISITTGTLLTGGLQLNAGRSLTLTVTNLLTDGGAPNGAFWAVGQAAVNNGFTLTRLPAGGDLLGTTIETFAPATRTVANTWAGRDYGASIAGFSNNAAIGKLVLDSLGPTNNTKFYFTGAGTNNAIYVDYLLLADQATNRGTTIAGPQTSTNFVELTFNTNMVIYYAQAVMNGVSIADKINHWNGDHLRWVPQYNGYFSSTNLVYANGTTNAVNAALAQAHGLDSNQNGTANYLDSQPLFVPSQINLKDFPTNVTFMAVQWNSINDATNYIYWSTNMGGPFASLLTNFVTIAPIPPAGPWPVTNTVYDSITSPPRYYRAAVWPNSADTYGLGF